MGKLEIMDLTKLCSSFPEIACSTVENDGVIERDNIIDTLETILNGETQIVGVEGEEGIGKTVLLAQFANRNSVNSISVFIRPASRWGYDPALIRYDICNQLNWLISGLPIDEPQNADDSSLKTLIMKLLRRTRLKQEKYYFVIDGLDDIPSDNWQTKKVILDMLPIGYSSLRFLFSGDLKKILGENSLISKSFPLSGFIYAETVQYFKEFQIDSQSLQEIHKTFKGLPGKLATIRRIFESQPDIEFVSFVKEMTNNLSDLFEVEWKSVDNSNEDQLKLLSLFAFERKIHSADSLGDILGFEREKVLSLLKNLSFISVEEHELSFVSEAYRRFVTEKLFYLKSQAHELIIDHLFIDPESEAALKDLPGYLEQAGRLEDLIDYLSPEHFEEMLYKSQSLSVVEQKAELGINTALNLRRDGELVRFSIQRAAIRELDGAQIWRSEIEARMALKQYETAVALAQATMLKEDRLHLLAVIARKKKEDNSGPEPELIEDIRQIFKLIDHTALGKRAVEIASDLIHVLPDLAIELVEHATTGLIEDENIDFAFATLSLAVDGKLPDYSETVRTLDSRIKDPRARRISTGIPLLVREFSASQMIAEVEKLLSISDRLYMLRQWAKSNSRRDDAHEVIEYGMMLAIRTTSYSTNALVLREMASPLPFVKEIIKAKELVGIFDSQKGAIEHLGPTEEFVRLQLILAKTESKYDNAACANRLIEVYLYSSYILDLAIKSACMARLVSELEEIDNLILKATDNLQSLAQQELMEDVKTLLISTANHFEVTKLVTKALAINKPEMAQEIANSLNTMGRRDLSLQQLINSYISIDVSDLDFNLINNLINQIEEPTIKDRVIIKIIKRLELSKKEVNNNCFVIINRIHEIEDSGSRCNTCCDAISIISSFENEDGMKANLIKLLERSWTAIDIGWHKVDTGFKIAASLSSHWFEMGKTYLDLTDEFRDELLLDSKIATVTYYGCISLSIRAYSGLLVGKREDTEDFERLHKLINRIPSNGERILLWGELALRAYLKERIDIGNKVVAEHLKPLLSSYPEEDYRSKKKIISYIAPVLYLSHKLSAFELINPLPVADRDIALTNIIRVILTKTSLSDPFDESPGKEFRNVNFENILDICEILDKIDHDGTIYYYIYSISSTMSARKAPFSQQQKIDISIRLTDIVNGKFPSLRNIKHDGYKIACYAVIQRINRKSNPWVGLIEQAKGIPNLADQAHVLTVIAVSIPSKDAEFRLSVLREAKELVERIPAALDKIQHYEILASMAVDISIPWAKEMIRLAVKSAFNEDNPDLHETQKNLINLAYRVDPELASSLAALIDDDEGRREVRSNLNKQIQILDLKKDMTDSKKQQTDHSKNIISEYAQAAWMALGSFNAGRVVGSISIDEARKYFRIASGGTFNESYAIMSWVVENLIVKYAKTDHAIQFLRPVFEATVIGAELSGRMAERSTLIQQRKKTAFSATLQRSNFIIQPNDREDAVYFIRQWLEKEAKDFVKICDPYFCLDDLEILQIISSVNPLCKVEILTGLKEQKVKKLAKPYSETYMDYWRLRISDQDPPDTDIVMVGTKPDGEPPFHDRWWLTEKSGLRMGTSYNSLGNKLSEISIVEKEEAIMMLDQIDQYLYKKIREYKDSKLQYESFNLA